MRKTINKVLNKLELLFLSKKVFSLPRNVQIEPTNLCNQKCKMCPRSTHLDVPYGSMNLGSFKEIFNKIPTIENLQLNGLGEPLLNEDIFEMIMFAKSRGANVTITSNCGVMTLEKAEKLLDSGLDLMKISLDSMSPEIYRSIRGADSEPSYRGIRTFMEARKKSGIIKPAVWFNSILMKETAGGLLDILKFAQEVGVDLVRFKPVNFFDLYKDKNLAVEQSVLKKAVEDTIAASKDLKIKHNLKKVLENLDSGIYNRPKEKIPCYAPWQEIYIQQYGGVRLCCEFYSKNYDMGNIFEGNLGSVWNDKKIKHVRSEFAKGNTFFPVCQACNRFQKNIIIHNKIKRLTGKN